MQKDTHEEGSHTPSHGILKHKSPKISPTGFSGHVGFNTTPQVNKIPDETSHQDVQ